MTPATRYEFMLGMGPLRLRNVTESPVNPIAVLMSIFGAAAILCRSTLVI